MIFDNIEIISWDMYEENSSTDKNFGHSILLPYNVINTILSDCSICNNPIYIKIINTNKDQLVEIDNSIIFSNFEVHDNNTCVIPYWALSKINLLQFDKVSIQYIYDISKIGFIKLKANNSNYVYWDNIKKILELELEKYQCLNLGDLIIINEVEFYVTELHDIFSKSINYGSLFNTEPSIEFDVPIDIEYEEILQNNILNNEHLYKHKTLEELEKDDNSNAPALSFTLDFHTGEEIKILEKYWSENKNACFNKRY